jgi:hypothetical protein
MVQWYALLMLVGLIVLLAEIVIRAG